MEMCCSWRKTKGHIWPAHVYFYVGSDPGLPDFSWYNIPKGEKYQNIPNRDKIYEMAVK
jgi:hypothetical protein